MDKILELDKKIIDAMAASGIDFVFLGGPGSEIISPAYYEKYLVPYSQLITDYAHSKGLLIYSHICSPIEPMLSKGYYNQMGIDLFETLSLAPEGNITSLADAFTKLDNRICTRGNVSLSKMMTGTPELIRQEVHSIMEAAKGRKHIVAASDYLMYDVPEANVETLCNAVEEYYKEGE
jgi:uroporphyrinogen-III decarboxylase